MKHLSLLLLLAVMLTGCPPNQVTKNDDHITEVILRDFNMSAAPNELDKVGFIFAVDNNKKQIPISYLNITPMEGIAKLKDYSESRKITWGIFANFLGVKTLDLTANAGVKDTSQFVTSIAFDNTTLVRAPLLDIDAALSAKKKDIKEYINREHLENLKFYLIIETVKAKKVIYKFDKDVVGNQSLDANFKKIVELNQEIKWDKSKNFQLEFDFASPLNVFYKTYTLDIESGLTGSFDIKVNKKNEVGSDGMIYIKK